MARKATAVAHPAALELERAEDGLLVRLTGSWRLGDELPRPEVVARALDAGRVRRAALDGAGVTAWDSALVAFLAAVLEGCRARGVAVDPAGLEPSVRRLLALAEESTATLPATAATPPPLARLGLGALGARQRLDAGLDFLGETTLGLGRAAARRARFRRVDLGLLLQQSGAEALPIVVLVNFLVGIILAFVGITQLRHFGAESFVADIVGIAVVRDMAALITAVALAGRSGAAFAAQLATMKVTQEIDALRTLGVAPVDFLVVPRVIALTAMTPLLTLFADAAGVLGGAAVGTLMLHQPLAGYLRQTALALGPGDLVGGLVKGATYGLLVALTGAYRGMQAERSAARVGEAATRAVVSGIVAIIAACGLFQYVFFLFGW